MYVYINVKMYIPIYRLARGERVLAMLHLFRAAGGTATSRIYEKVVNSIYLCQPCNDAEWFVVNDPGVYMYRYVYIYTSVYACIYTSIYVYVCMC
jgi:hypothetical protein